MYTSPVFTAIVLKNGQLNSAGDNLIPYPQHLFIKNKVADSQNVCRHFAKLSTFPVLATYDIRRENDSLPHQ